MEDIVISKSLKAFLKDNFDFSTLKKVRFYPKDMKHNDYEGQAKRICHFFGFESVYGYGKHEIRCHISYAGTDPAGDPAGMGTDGRPVCVDESGEFKTLPFVETFFPNQLHI